MVKKLTPKKTKTPNRPANNYPPSRPYRIGLLKRLKDREYAAIYLNTAFEESLKDDEESQQILLSALEDVAEAQGTTVRLTKRALSSIKNINRLLSNAAFLHEMGLTLTFSKL